MYKEGNPVKNQTPAQFNLIGRSMTAPSLALSPSIILPPTCATSHSLPQGKTRRAFKKCHYFGLFLCL
jgi:hypothetical protein